MSFPPGDYERDYDPIHPRGTDWRGLLRRIWAPIGAAINPANRSVVAV